MRIHDLTTAEDLALLQSGAFAVLEAKMPWFYSHYLSIWADRKRVYAVLSEEQVAERKQWITEELVVVAKKAESVGWDLAKVEVVLFVGKGVSNGHSFLHGDTVVVWYALESYGSKQLVETFVAHEFAHGLQYMSDPRFAFRNTEEKNALGRQLLTEGFATFATEQLKGMQTADAMWANFLPADARDAWVRECDARWNELLRHSARYWDYDAGEFFQANDSSDIFRFRAGYYVGARLIREYAAMHKLDWSALARVQRAELERGIRKMSST